MIRQAAPRQPAGTQRGITDCTQLVAALVPRPELAPDYIALAALLHRPNLAVPQISRLHPSAWSRDFHQIAVRILLAHLAHYGRADRAQLMRLLHGGGFRRDRVAIELDILDCLASLLNADLVRWAAEAIAARQGVSV